MMRRRVSTVERLREEIRQQDARHTAHLIKDTYRNEEHLLELLALRQEIDRLRSRDSR